MTTATHAAPSARATVDGAQLLAGIDELALITPKRTTLPVLSYVLLEAGNDGLTLTATDADSWLRVRLDYVGDDVDPWSLCAPLRALRAIVGDAEVHLSPRGDRLHVENGDLVTTLHGFRADEFPSMPPLPKMPGFPDGDVMLWDAAVVGPVLARCRQFSSTEESRPILHGALVRAAEGTAHVAATNGHMLRVETIAVPWQTEAILSRPALRVFSTFDGMVRVAQNDPHIFFTTQDRQACARLIEGPYPNYEQVIPTRHATEVTLDRVRFLAAVERVLPIASDQTHRTRASFTLDRSTIEVETPDIGAAVHPLPVLSFAGESMTIGFNGEYLTTALRASSADIVTLRLLAPERAVVLLDGSGATQLLMPLRLLD